MSDELPSFLEEGAAADLHGWKKAAGRLPGPQVSSATVAELARSIIAS